MELTINIKEQKKIAFFLNLLHEFSYIEIMDIKDDETSLPKEHKKILEDRLKMIENNKTTFKSWDLIKEKYDKKAI